MFNEPRAATMTHDKLDKKVQEIDKNVQEIRTDIANLLGFVTGVKRGAVGLFVILLAGGGYFIDKIDRIDRNVQTLRNIVATSEQIDLLEGAMFSVHWNTPDGSAPDASEIFRDLNRDLAGSQTEQIMSANRPDSGVNQEWAQIIVGDATIEAYASRAHVRAMALNYKGASTHTVVAPFDAIVVREGMATKFNTSEDMQKDETYLEVALEGETYGVDLWRFAKTFVKEGDSVKRGDLIGEVTSATEADSMLCLTVQVHRKGSSIPLNVSPFIMSFVEFTGENGQH